jgi:hypothetical protein
VAELLPCSYLEEKVWPSITTEGQTLLLHSQGNEIGGASDRVRAAYHMMGMGMRLVIPDLGAARRFGGSKKRGETVFIRRLTEGIQGQDRQDIRVDEDTAKVLLESRRLREMTEHGGKEAIKVLDTDGRKKVVIVTRGGYSDCGIDAGGGKVYSLRY